MARRQKNTHRPPEFDIAHQTVLAIHDVLLHQLHAGYRGDAYSARFQVAHDEGPEKDEHPLLWVNRTQPPEVMVDLLARSVYPALLGDFLHFIYEAMECARKGKLTVSFVLLRKPLAENLGMLEAIAGDVVGYVERLAEGHRALNPMAAGGMDAHEKRVRVALEAAGAEQEFDARYIAQLRYDKGEFDSFAGASDQATHLYTDHKKIQTEPLNLNFIFSDYESTWTQWAYIYSRLPYLMAYTYEVLEHTFGWWGRTDPVYLDDIGRRMDAALALWGGTIPTDYRSPEIDTFLMRRRASLNQRCVDRGWRLPRQKDLEVMARTGRWPGEGAIRHRVRMARFKYGVRYPTFASWLYGVTAGESEAQE